MQIKNFQWVLVYWQYCSLVHFTWFFCRYMKDLRLDLASWFVQNVRGVYYVPWSAPNFDTDSHQSYHGWGLVKKYPMQNFRPLELQEPLLEWPWSFHRNPWQRQDLHNRNIDSNANSIQTSTSPWRRFLLSQRPKILHGMFFYQASTVVRLVRAIVEVWGALIDVTYTVKSFLFTITLTLYSSPSHPIPVLIILK